MTIFKKRLILMPVVLLLLLVASMMPSLVYGRQSSIPPLSSFQEPTPSDVPENIPRDVRIILQADVPAGQLRSEDMDTVVSVLSNRLESLGYNNAIVRQQGMDRLIVEIEDVDVQTFSPEILTQTGQLVFVNFTGYDLESFGCILVEPVMDVDEFPEPTEEPAESDDEQTPTPLPSEDETGPCPDGGFPVGTNGEMDGPPFPIARDSEGHLLTGNLIASASVEPDEFGGWRIAFELNEQGSEIFADYTSRHIVEPLAIVMDGAVLSAPIIQARISGSGVITGEFTRTEALILASQLRAGALPFSLTIEAFDTIEKD